jgi:hypothetical protein
MADTSVVDLDTDFMRFGRCDLDILNAEVLAGFPGNCCLYPVSACSSLVVLARVVFLGLDSRLPALHRYPFRSAQCLHRHALRIRMPSPTCNAVIGVCKRKLEKDAFSVYVKDGGLNVPCR